jgi:nucleoside phosphorylase
LLPLLSRWYAFGPWLLLVGVIWREYGWRRALPLALGGWLIAFAAEWSSTAGPGIPFGSYSYRSVGLAHDWRLLGVPLFDSLSFTWLAGCGYLLAGWLGARGYLRLLLAALAMVAIDAVVDPVALRGAHWWLGSIYSYPPGTGFWFGVSALNFVGWFVVGLALQLWLRLCLGQERPASRLAVGTSAVLVAGVMGQSTVLAIGLGIGTSALAALGLLLALGLLAWLARSQPPTPAEARVVVACALRWEAAAARRALGPGWHRAPAAGFCRWARAQSPGVEVWETGIGQRAAARAARQAPAEAAILVAGVGGACSPGWPVGAVGVATRVLAADGSWLRVDPIAQQGLLDSGVGRSAVLASRETAADSVSARRELAAVGVDIVEMETAGWLESRPSSSGAPLAALRTVMDTPEAPLGRTAGLVRQGASGPSAPRVARLLLTHPNSLSELISVGRRQRLALAAMATAVAGAVPALLAAMATPDMAAITPFERENGAGAPGA